MDSPAVVLSGSAAPPVLYTIGHSNVALQELLALLGRFEIEIVVDVRSRPYSRFSPQYNRESLSAALQQAGISYQFLGDSLGGWPSDPGCYKPGTRTGSKTGQRGEVDYSVVVTRTFFQEGIARLLEIARSGRTAILCSEADPAKCHRHLLIGRYLAGQGVNVLHILHNGTLISEQQLTTPGGVQKPAQPSLL